MTPEQWESYMRWLGTTSELHVDDRIDAMHGVVHNHTGMFPLGHYKLFFAYAKRNDVRDRLNLTRSASQ